MRCSRGHLLAVLAVAALTSTAGGQPVCPPDEIQARASGDTITVRHSNAERNCCTDLTLVVRTQDFVVDFLESEAGEVCRCTCCFDMHYSASGFEAGRWTVRVWDETASVLYGEAVVDVTGAGGSIALGVAVRGDCTVGVAAETWSAVRNLYR